MLAALSTCKASASGWSVAVLDPYSVHLACHSTKAFALSVVASRQERTMFSFGSA